MRPTLSPPWKVLPRVEEGKVSLFDKTIQRSRHYYARKRQFGKLNQRLCDIEFHADYEQEKVFSMMNATLQKLDELEAQVAEAESRLAQLEVRCG